MTPEERSRLESLERFVREVSPWLEERRRQLLPFPLDPASKASADQDNLIARPSVGSGAKVYKVAGTPATDGYIAVTINGTPYKVTTTA